MKATCLQENLNQGLSIVNRAISQKPMMPILSNLLLSAEKGILSGRINLMATDLSLSIRTFVEAKVEEDGTTTIPAKLLSDLVSSMRNDTVELRLDKKLSLVCGKVKSQISSFVSSDFPPFPSPQGTKFLVDSAALRTGLQQVVFAAADKEARPILTGIHFLLKDKRLTLCGADGFRLSIARIPVDIEETTKLTIPASTIVELIKLLTKDEKVEVILGNLASFKLSSLDFVSQVLAGDYPNVLDVVPENPSTKARVDVNDLGYAVKMAGVFGKLGKNVVRLKLQKGSIEVRSWSDEMGENESEVVADVEGPDCDIAFNGEYLQQHLDSLDGKILVETSGGNAPGVLRGATSVHVISPMAVTA